MKSIQSPAPERQPLVTVRAARPTDLRTLVAFNRAMALETEGRQLALGVLRRGVERALRDPAKGRYLVAVLGRRVAGALLLTREWSDWRDGWFWWIQSVYVRPESRGRGLYSALHRAVLSQAAAAGDVRGTRLYVESGNHVARRAYRRLGMQCTSYRLYEALLSSPVEAPTPRRRPQPARTGSRRASRR
ncbi:MAG: GNAT family N-acetyltransferase [Planctomycetota bacterium]